ncbi:MAG: hypothetical protein DRN24_01035, partial [Thermoplasmata archaeon]
MKTKIFLEAVVVAIITLSLILPTSAMVTTTKSVEKTNPLWVGKTKIDIKNVKTWDKHTKPLPAVLGNNIQISGWAPGDERRPSITMDSQGNVFITWEYDEDILTSSAAFAYNPDPFDQEAWWENGVILTLQDIEMLAYPDTAFIGNAGYELMTVFVALDTEETGGIFIPDVTDYETWEPYTWTGGSPEPEIAQISDDSWYQDLNYPDVVGPFNFYIYHEIYEEYDIPSCPVCFHTGVEAASGVGYFDAQSNEKTAPAADPDMVNLPDRFHTIIYNTDTSKIIWKKIVPAEEPDYEYTPYQATIADGTNPSIAAYDTNVAVVYMNNDEVKCVYSTDDGNTWSAPVTISTGAYPDIYALGNVFVAAYVDNGDLYLTISSDGGATWSTPNKINDVDGTVVAEENCIDIHRGGIVWVDDRNEDYDIYYMPLPSPAKPTITGPSKGKPNKEYSFTFKSTDPEGSNIYYYVDWGDGTYTDWDGPH